VGSAIESLVGHIQATKPGKGDETTEKTFGDEGIRTPDIRVANAALYQLSYVPERLRHFRVDEEHAFEDECFYEEVTVCVREGDLEIAEAHGTRLQAFEHRNARLR
jgi:hypothetical protein